MMKKGRIKKEKVRERERERNIYVYMCQMSDTIKLVKGQTTMISLK